MRLGLYIFAALTLGGIIGALAYTVNPNNYVVDFMGINFNFPVAVWVVLPMAILLVFTVFHMFFYTMKNYLKLKKWQKDLSALDNALYWSLASEPKAQKYAIETVRNSAVILSKSSLNVLDSVDGLNPRLSKMVNVITKIKNGEYVDLKEAKLLKVFNEGNPYLIQNRLNRLEADSSFVEEVMKSSASYSKMVQAQALEIFARKETFHKARKYAKVFDAKNFKVMLSRVTEEEDMGLTTEILNEFVQNLKLSCKDFVEIANITKKQLRPSENLALFKQYQLDNVKAQNAYLYLLFDYELLDEVATYLEEHEEGEFVKFRALYDLKKENKNYRLEDLIDSNSVC
jgi:hypothetical protein